MTLLVCVIVSFAYAIEKSANPNPSTATPTAKPALPVPLPQVPTPNSGTGPSATESSTQNPAAKVPKIETVSSRKLISLDQQIFILHEDVTTWATVPALSFARGERVQRTFPAPVEDWENWREKFDALLKTLPKGKKCPHPLVLQSDIKDEGFTDKEVCLNEITPQQRNQIQSLAQEWNAYLYGK